MEGVSLLEILIWARHNKSGILIPFCLQSQNSTSYQNVNYFQQYPFVYSSYYPKDGKKNYTKYLQIHCEKYKEFFFFFLHRKRREYQATGALGQNISTFFPTLRKKYISYRILSYYLQLKHWLSSQNDTNKIHHRSSFILHLYDSGSVYKGFERFFGSLILQNI